MKKRFFRLVAALAFCLALLPVPAGAAEPEEPGLMDVEGQAGAEEPVPFLRGDTINYLTCDDSGKIWEVKTCDFCTEVAAVDTIWPAGWYVVKGTITITGRVTVSGEVHLILADGCRLTAQEGISVAEAGSCLTIYAQSTEEASMGQLDATGNGDNAAIGGSGAHNKGVITINGGRVTATATGYGAGIGGGGRGDGGADNTIYGPITINGGIVTAKGGYNSHGAAGIGGGKGNGGCTITINGGKVTATGGGGNSGAGIGGGSWAGGGTIIISGGSVTATGGGGSAGIGGGSGYNGSEGSFSTGENGNAFIVATSIGATTNINDWSGVIFRGNAGRVYGVDVTLTEDATVPENATLTVPEGSTLTVPAGVTLTNRGTVVNNGKVAGDGTVSNYAAWEGQASSAAKLRTASVTTVSALLNGAAVNSAPDDSTVTVRAVMCDREDSLYPAISGKVAFTANGRALGTARVENGKAEVPLTLDGSVGQYHIQAAYSGGEGTDPSHGLLDSSGTMDIAVEGARPIYNFLLNNGNIQITKDAGGVITVEQGGEKRVLSVPAPIRITGEPGEPTPNTISVWGGVEIILSGVNQGGGNDGNSWKAPIAIERGGESGTVTLTLEGENVLAASGSYDQGISVRGRCTLTIQGPGSLKIGGENTRMGIGIGGRHETGNVVINGGVLDITAQNVAIGSDNMMMMPGEDAPSITINGGSVELSGNGNKIKASENGSFGSVTITGGSISGVAGEDGILPAPTDGKGKALVPVTVSTGKTDTPVDALGITGTEYGSPAKTDGNGNLTLYLPKPGSGEEAEYTGLAIIGGEVQELTASAKPDGAGTGSAEGTGIRVETPEDAKPEIQSDGSIELPGGSRVTKGNATITVPEGGGTVKPAGNGRVEVSGGSTITPAGGTAMIMGPQGGTVDGAGNVTVPGDGSVTISDGKGGNITITVPKDGGTINPGTGRGVIVPAGSRVQTGGVTQTIPEGGGVVMPGGGSFPGGGNPGGGGPGDSDSAPPDYPPTVETHGEGGTASVTPSRPGAGDAVTITPKPDTGYEVDQVTVTDKGGRSVAVTENPDGTFTFTQLAGKVKIEVSYKPIVSSWQDPYGDVSENAWYSDAVRFVAENGLMNGYGDGRFGPDDELSRAQLAQILYHHAQRPDLTDAGPFADVPNGIWYTDAVTWAAANGIVGGYGNGMFGPGDPVTREQLAVMLWRYSGSPAAAGQALHFADADQTSDWALEAMCWAVENGILNGYGDGTLAPGGQATRAEAAQMLRKFMEP